MFFLYRTILAYLIAIFCGALVSSSV
uniref:Uncharacterized protein n=1 Tax=Arundo donax TaxID=35708 RepID=A0A0A9BXL9_ARUDO